MKILFFLLLPFLTFAGEQPYNAARISPILSAGADAVVRQHIVKLDIKSPKKSVENIKIAITILNKNGDHFAEFKEFYEGAISMHDFKAAIYDANGKKVLTIKKSDLKDYSTNWSNHVLFDGGFVKYYEPNYPQYPYTIEYEYELHSKGSLHYSPFMPQSHYDLAVEEARFEVSGEPGAFRYKTQNLPKNTVYTEVAGVHTWQFSNITAILYEPLVESFKQITPYILLAPNDFEYHNFAGNMSDWKQYGAWAAMLHTDRDLLPEAAVAEMQALRKATPDDHELVAKVYQYMQKRSRYIYIGLGIGGFQPIEAKKVHELGYGDCKALSNYTKALLSAAGIKAYPALIYAGEGDQYDSFTFSDFASMGQANHEIVCVPFARDTVWLECTSQTLPAGFLGDFTDNRRALLITENGGILVKTPQYKTTDNLIKRTVNVSLTAKGGSSVSAETQYNGIEFSDRQHLINETNKEQIKAFEKTLNSAVTIENYALSEVKTQMQERVKWQNSAQAAVTGKRIFVPIYLYKPEFGAKINDKPRKNSFFLSKALCYDETTTFTIPEKFKVEALPQNANTKTIFGTYTNEITKKDNTISIHRTFTLPSGTFAAENYTDFIAFLTLVATNDAAKMVLVQDM